MFSDDFYRYAVLTPNANNVINTRIRWYQQRKITLVIVLIVSPVVLFFILYGLLFGFHRNIIYPRTASKVLSGNLHRAITYSLSIANSTYDPSIQFKIPKKIPITKYKLVCYYSLPDDSTSLQIDHIDPHLCTHINAAFGRVVNSSLYLTDYNKECLKKIVKLKQINNDLKVLVSVGGAGDIQNGFPEMVVNHTNRKIFIKSVVSFVKEFEIDGIDLDWEFPNVNNTEDKRQKLHFMQLLVEIRKSINRQKNLQYLLTVAVAAPLTIVEQSYDVAHMNDYVDFVNLMSYDYHFYTKWTPFTGFNSPLYASDNEVFIFSTLNVNYSANYWYNLGMDRSKIIVGLPIYAHTFRLTNPKNNKLYAPASGYGRLGSLGFADYPDVCKFLAGNQISPVFDMETKSPYASKYYEWVSFENTLSLTYKAEYIRDQQFGGAMVWSLNADDYKFHCPVEGPAKGKFPLVNSIRNVLFGS